MTNLVTPVAAGTKLYVVGNASSEYSEGVILVDSAGNPVAKPGLAGVDAITTPAWANLGPNPNAAAGLTAPSYAQVNPYGMLRVSPEPHTLFRDLFDGAALDTTGNWVAPTGTNAPAITSGALVFPSNTTPNVYGKLTSQAGFGPIIPGFSQPSFFMKTEAAPPTGASRFWGIGTSPATPTPAAPLTDAVGWLIDTDGKLYAVVYAGGTAVVKQDLSSTGLNAQKLDGNLHRYLMQVRTDLIYWFVDSLDVPVFRANGAGVAAGISPNNQSLPVLLQTANGATPSAAPSLQVQGAIVADTASNNSTMSDPGYPAIRESVLPLPAASVPGQTFGGATVSHDPAVYYASARGGRVLFGASVGLIASPTSGNPFMLLENPAGSGVNLYIWRIVIGSDRSGQYVRYRNPVINTRGAAVAEVNAGGGANRSAGKLYASGQFTLTSNGTLAKVQFAAGTGSTGSEIQSDERLTMILPPGQAVMWTYTGSAGNLTGEIVWAEALAF